MFEHLSEKRCFGFASRVREFCRKFRFCIANREDARQLVRASGSVGANYIEANENTSELEIEIERGQLVDEAKQV